MAVKFQRRHYEALAKVLQKQAPSVEKSQIVNDLAKMFAGDNLDFSYGTWFAACEEERTNG